MKRNQVNLVRRPRVSPRWMGVLLGAALVGSTETGASAQTITGIGHLPGELTTRVLAMSADGSTVVGEAATRAPDYGVGHAFRWTRASGMQDLGGPPGGYSAALGVNADGSVVVGYGGSGGPYAFRWTSATGIQDLGVFPGGTNSFAEGVSADGSVVVGYSYEGPTELRAFRWTSADGMQELAGLPGATSSAAYDVSSDGSVIVGDSGGHVVRWTTAGAIEDLGLLPNPGVPSAISADGSTIVGGRVGGLGIWPVHAFRWTNNGGIEELVEPPGTLDSYATAVNRDGSMIVGACLGDVWSIAVLWDATLGLVDLHTYLADRGIDLGTWELLEASGISHDGLTIAGLGFGDSSRHEEGWIATLARCSADFNNDVLVNSQDFFDFLIAFFAADPVADFNADGTVDSTDVFDFLTAFFAGCA